MLGTVAGIVRDVEELQGRLKVEGVVEGEENEVGDESSLPVDVSISHAEPVRQRVCLKIQKNTDN